MEDVQAVHKDSCPACGAQAEWDPGKAALLCRYCGTEAPGELDTETGKVAEIPLVATLREVPESQRGWEASTRTVKCQQCKAVSVFEAKRAGQDCEFCGSPQLVPYEEIKSPLRPHGVLPFQVTEEKVRESIREWYSSKWLAPSALRKRAMLDTIKGVYIPYWTFDADVYCAWSADSGRYYYTTERFRDANGQMQTRQVQHVEWTPVSGQLRHFFDDTPIPGTTGLHPELLREVEPFPTQDAVPYDTAFLSGFIVEHYQVVLIEAARQGRERMERELYNMCAGDIPGDTHRNLHIEPQYHGETFKHILAPVWVLTYQYGKDAYQVIVNGQTGEIAGEAPLSWWKVTLLVIFALVALALLFGLYSC